MLKFELRFKKACLDLTHCMLMLKSSQNVQPGVHSQFPPQFRILIKISTSLVLLIGFHEKKGQRKSSLFVSGLKLENFIFLLC